jgi:hypothetical protein
MKTITILASAFMMHISHCAFSQLPQLDSLNGYKIIKLGTPIGLYQDKVTSTESGVSKNYTITDPEMFSIGDITLKKVGLQTVSDTVRYIILTTDDTNGKNLYLAMYKRFGIPNGKADHINSSYLWKGNKLHLSIQKKGNEWQATYIDVPFEKRVEREKEKKKLSDF